MSETTPISGDLDGSRFTVDLGETNLTDEEVNGLQNAITRLIVETVRKKSSTATAKRKKPPYPKIIITHVRSTHVRSPTK